MPEIKTCATCRFFDTADIGESDFDYNDHCRAHPPRVVPQGEDGWKTVWPVARKQDWCGEWEADA